MSRREEKFVMRVPVHLGAALDQVMEARKSLLAAAKFAKLGGLPDKTLEFEAAALSLTANKIENYAKEQGFLAPEG